MCIAVYGLNILQDELNEDNAQLNFKLGKEVSFFATLVILFQCLSTAFYIECVYKHVGTV